MKAREEKYSSLGLANLTGFTNGENYKILDEVFSKGDNEYLSIQVFYVVENDNGVICQIPHNYFTPITQLAGVFDECDVDIRKEHKKLKEENKLNSSGVPVDDIEDQLIKMEYWRSLAGETKSYSRISRLKNKLNKLYDVVNDIKEEMDDLERLVSKVNTPTNNAR